MSSAAFTITYPARSPRVISSAWISNESNPEAEIEVQVLWDTGATTSVITETLALKIGLPVIAKSKMRHAGGESLVNVHKAKVRLLRGVVINDVRMLSCPAIHEFGAIIGMDIISLGDFAFTNKDGKSVFSFRVPSLVSTDYVKEHNDETKRILKSKGVNSKCPCGSGKKIKNCCGKELL